MKTILVPTDFSGPSKNAGYWAFYIANTFKTNVVLCHALSNLVNEPGAIQTSNSEEASSTLLEAANERIQSQCNDLLDGELENAAPNVGCVVARGTVADVVQDLFEKKEIGLVVMGMFGAGLINRVLLGSTSKHMIDQGNFPVLLVPFRGFRHTINKIAFATDLSKGDVALIHSLAGFARAFNAEILIVHISGEKTDRPQVDNFLNEVTCKVNYPKIYYRDVADQDIDHGLNWIAKNAFIDVFAMVHRRKGFPGNLFTGSYTHKLSRSIDIPLLVFPENEGHVF